MLDAEQWSQLLASFVEEARDLARQAEEYLLQLDAQPTDEDAINGLFRAMHTLKGSAGLFSLTPLVDFTHRLENLLMAVRDGQRSLDPALISVMLRCVDEVGSMIELIDVGSGSLEVDGTHQAQLLAALAEQCGEPGPVLIPLTSVASSSSCASLRISSSLAGSSRIACASPSCRAIRPP